MYQGGDSYEMAVVGHLAQKLFVNAHRDVRGNEEGLRKLRLACERAKRELSHATHASISVERLHEGTDFRTTISHARFNHINASLFARCLQCVEQALQDARVRSAGEDSGADIRAVDEVLLVGGATRMPRLVLCFLSTLEANSLIQASIRRRQ